MKRLLASVTLLFSLSLTGCGGGDQGPADPTDTPQISEEEIQRSMMKGMPEEQRKKYGLESGGASETPAAPAGTNN